MRCMYCGEELRWDKYRGWVHARGGGNYMMRCPECGWREALNPSPVRCPKCGSRKIRDEHIARPDMSREEV